jgi:hypothetical protein
MKLALFSFQYAENPPKANSFENNNAYSIFLSVVCDKGVFSEVKLILSDILAEFSLLNKDGTALGDQFDIEQPMSLQEPLAIMRNSPFLMKVYDVMETIGWEPYQVSVSSTKRPGCTNSTLHVLKGSVNAFQTQWPLCLHFLMLAATDEKSRCSENLAVSTRAS